MNHLAVGAAIPFLIGLLFYIRARGRASLRLLVGTPAAMFACATWAVLPDLPRTFGFSGYDTTLNMNPKIDIFFWHYTINLYEGHTEAAANIAFALMLAGLFLAAWRELHCLEYGRGHGSEASQD